MAAPLPAKLKLPSIQPFVTRANQLSKYKPIIAYWCDYYVVNQILNKGLHSADDECKEYTINLMDKLETVKAAGEDAIIDDVVAKAYVEQFALETFQRGDDAIHTNKASRQTIDTFQAATTFLELLSIWDTLDAETSAKIKYAKFHALRIAKALKAGDDPNASNPVEEEPPVTRSDAGMDGLQPSSAAYLPPSVESAPASGQPSRPTSISQATPLAPPPAANAPGLTAPVDQDLAVSPIDPAESATSRQGSIGGGYFPSVPTFTSEPTAPATSTADADSDPPISTPRDVLSPTAPPAQNFPSPSDFYTQQTPSQPPPAAPPAVPPQAPPSQPAAPAPAPAPVPMPSHAPPPSRPIAQPPPQAIPAAVPAGGYRTDDESVALAQKHAKWAMSALNFEDVKTAVKELRLALRTLGAE